jgi:hypothetical protein
VALSGIIHRAVHPRPKIIITEVASSLSLCPPAPASLWKQLMPSQPRHAHACPVTQG